MHGVPLRNLLPLGTAELAGTAAAIADHLAEIHGRGEVHGDVSLDTVIVRAGQVELGRAPGTGSWQNDVAALGRVVAAALTGAPAWRRDVYGPPLAEIANDARRAVLTNAPTATELAQRLIATVPTARLPRLSERGRDAAPSLPVGRAWPRLAFLVAFLVATIVVLGRAGASLPPPPLADGPTAVTTWVEGRDAATALFSCVRFVVLALGWYLLVTTLVSVVLGTLAGRHGASARVAEALLLPPVRRLVHGAVGATIAVGSVATTPPADPAPTVMGRVRAPEVVTVQLVDDIAPTVVQHVDDAPAVDAIVPTSGEWVVTRGDHFWSIARRELERVWKRSVTDKEVDGYWRVLVAANRDRLVDRGNPDLLLPSQRLRLPAPPADR